VTGSDGNIDAGEELAFGSPLVNVESNVLVGTSVTEGEDDETDDSYRERILARIQNPPAGGTIADYVSFARDVAGVTRAWVTPGLLGEGTVVVYFVEDDDDPIFPDAAKIQEVQDSIDAQRPVTADATAVAPTERTVDFDISIKPNTQAVRDAVTAELEDLFLREGEVAGSYKEVGVQNDGRIPLSKINEAISAAQGEEDHILNSPSAEIDPVTGDLLTIGTITFSTLV